MVIGDSLRVSDLRVPEGVKFLDDPETVLATVRPPTKIEEPEVVEEEARRASCSRARCRGRGGPRGPPSSRGEPEADAAGEEQNSEG